VKTKKAGYARFSASGLAGLLPVTRRQLIRGQRRTAEIKGIMPSPPARGENPHPCRFA
jgi:hypothetical protein